VSAMEASEVALLGWWLYSLLCMLDTALLTKMIVKIIHSPVSLQWMRILDGSTWEPDQGMTKDPRAIHIETTLLADKEEVKRCLKLLYGSESKQFPLQICRSFVVPVIQSFADVDTLRSKCKELCKRQHGRITQHVAKTTYDMINHDHKDQAIEKQSQEYH
jgi:hypothetical protein